MVRLSDGGGDVNCFLIGVLWDARPDTHTGTLQTESVVLSFLVYVGGMICTCSTIYYLIRPCAVCVYVCVTIKHSVLVMIGV